MLKETASTQKVTKTNCADCPLRAIDAFRDFDKKELEFVRSFKRGETVADAGTTIISQGSSTPFLYTVMTGWGFRYKTMEDGRRQVLNYVLPGDFVGLQATLMHDMEHSVETLSTMELCVFEREQFYRIFEQSPTLAFDITWIAAREERILDEHIVSLGTRTALERCAYLIAYLHDRARQIQLFPRPAKHLPLTQQLVADTLGLSVVHTNRTLKKLAHRGLVRWTSAGCEVVDARGLEKLAEWSRPQEVCRPFI